VAEIRLGCLEGAVLGKEEVARETTLHLDDVSLGAQSFDFLFENHFNGSHGLIGSVLEKERDS
jgi:hypothetical protein